MAIIFPVVSENRKDMNHSVFYWIFFVIPSGFWAPWSTNEGQGVLECNAIPSPGVQNLLVQ